MSKVRFANLAALNTEIDLIARVGSELDARIQNAGLGCLEHLLAHGDVGPVNRLYLALSKGARKTAMTSWLLSYGSLSANADGKSKKEKPFNYDGTKKTNVAAAIEDPWFDHKPDVAPDVVFDLQKMMQMVLAKASGKQMTQAAHDGLKAACAASGVVFNLKVGAVITDAVKTAPVPSEPAADPLAAITS